MIKTYLCVLLCYSMKKILILAVVILSSVGWSLFAYNVQPWDNALLTTVYDRIDAVFVEDHTKLMTFLDSVFIYELRFKNDAQSWYFLEKIKEYIHGKLYTFVDSSKYICLDSRVQYGDSVTLNYTLQTTDGKKVTLPLGLETMQEENLALIFNAGKWQVIRGIDYDVLGKQSDKNYGVYLQPHDARWISRSWLILSLPTASVLQIAPNVAVWNTLTMSIEIGGVNQKRSGIVVSVDAETIAIDFNHVLVGEVIVGWYMIESFFKSCS